MLNVCRLCSNDNNVLDVYDSDLEYGQQLRLLIQSATGINIRRDDDSRMVCNRCCEIAVEFYQFRSSAVKNDKSLKEKGGQPYIPPTTTNKNALIRTASTICPVNVSDIVGAGSSDALRIHDNAKLNTGVISKHVPIKSSEDVTASTGGVDVRKKIIPNYSNVKSTSCSTTNKIYDDFNSSPSNTAVISRKFTLKNDLPTAKATSEDLRVISPSLRDASSSSKQNILIHRSVEKLFTENKSLILPDEVCTSDISPVISLDPTEVSDWYATQLHNLKKQIKQATDLNRNRYTKKLRKRIYKYIIEPSDSEDDSTSVPNKISRESNIDNTINKLPENISTTIVEKETPQKIIETNQNQLDPFNAHLMNISSQITPIGVQNNLEVPNSTSGQNLKNSALPPICPSPNIASKLYTDCTDFSINIENLESSIDEDVNILPDLQFLNVTIPTSAPDIVAVNGTSFIVKVLNEPDDDIICISDDDDIADDSATKIYSKQPTITSKDNEVIQSLFRKHVMSQNQTDNDCQTFKATNSIIRLTKGNSIAVENILPELLRFSIPIEWEFSGTKTARFVDNMKVHKRPLGNFWSQAHCLGVDPRSRHKTQKILNYSNPINLQALNQPYTPSVRSVVTTSTFHVPSSDDSNNNTVEPAGKNVITSSTKPSFKSTGIFYPPSSNKSNNVVESVVKNINRSSRYKSDLFSKEYSSRPTVPSFNISNSSEELPVLTLTDADLPVYRNRANGPVSQPQMMQPSFGQNAQQGNILRPSGTFNQIYPPPTYTEWYKSKSPILPKSQIRVRHISELINK